MTITEFLLARIAGDEEAARAAAHDGERWQTTTSHGPIVAIDNGTEWGGEPVVYDEGMPSEEQAAHIARHDPARVLAECEAMRRIVDEHRVWSPTGYRLADGRQSDVCTVDEQNWPCGTMRALAAIRDGHPDYREEWRA